MISTKDLAEWGSTLMVLLCGALAGHFAAQGMSPVQWAGATVAVLGSITVAVAVRVWAAPEKAEQD